MELLLARNQQSTGDMEPPEPWVAEALRNYKTVADSRTVPQVSHPDSSPSQKEWNPPGASVVDSLIDGFEVEEMIGRGGMGAVYRGRQISLQRLVAIKILPPEYGEAPGFADRFQREALAMARMNHPNIVTIYDFGSVEFESPSGSDFPPGKLLYFVMEFVDGTDLQRLIQSGDLEPDTALALIAQICDALQYAHGKGFIHRDIKPANIFITREGTVKVGDFGLAKLAGIGTDDSSNLTIAGHIVGTPHYLAPETLTGDGKVDHRADIFSLGVMFYQMLTGTLPKGSFPTPSEKAHVDIRLDEIVLKAMQSEPDLRYQQASEVKSDVSIISNEIATANTNNADEPISTELQADESDTKGERANKAAFKGKKAWIPALIFGLIVSGLTWHFLNDASKEDSLETIGRSGINLMTAEKWTLGFRLRRYSRGRGIDRYLTDRASFPGVQFIW